MGKIFKIFTWAVCIFLISIGFSLAADENAKIYFCKNDRNTKTTNYTIGLDVLYVDLQNYNDYEGVCYCAAASQKVAVSSSPILNGVLADSVVLTLVDYGGKDIKNAPDRLSNDMIPLGNNNQDGVPLKLATSRIPAEPGVLELEDGQVLNVNWNCTHIKIPDVTNTAVVSVAKDSVDTGDVIVRYDTSFVSGSIASGYRPNAHSIYVQVADSDENRRGYQQETIPRKGEPAVITVSSSLDSEILSLTETGNSTGIFRSAGGLALRDTDPGDSDDVLLVSSATDTITVSYGDPNDSADTEQVTVSVGSLLSGFAVSASSVQGAGMPFDLTITALQGDGTNLATYAGTVNLMVKHVSPASANGNISPTSVSFCGSDKGSKKLRMAYNDIGTIKITALDSVDSSVRGASGNIAFAP